MTVKCSICGRGFLSLLVDRDQAIGEISHGFVSHVTKEHNIQLQLFARDVNIIARLATWFVSMQLLVVDEGEKQFHEQFVKQGEMILRSLGLDEEQIKAVELKHRTRKMDDVATVKIPGTIVTQ